MRWGYIRGAGGMPVPLELPIFTHLNSIICGSSGSGKSYGILYLIGNLLQDAPDTILYICDFKNSQELEFLKPYPYYFSGNDSYEGIMQYYKKFCDARIQGRNKSRHLLIIEEYPALISYMSTFDKQNKTKKAGDILSAVSEILMLGRGISFGIWLVCQRPSASLFEGGARDNAMVTLNYGRMSKEQKSILFSGEEISDRVYKPGEGVILADGHSLYDNFCTPRIRNIVDWKKNIKHELMKHCNR